MSSVSPRALLSSPRLVVAVLAVVSAVGASLYWVGAGADDGMVVAVTRGSLEARLTSSGTLKPLQSITYRSPIPGRDVEVRDLAPEGSRVQAGDVVVRLDTTDLELELARARQELRQAQMDLQVAEGEYEDAGAELKTVSDEIGRAHV